MFFLLLNKSAPSLESRLCSSPGYLGDEVISNKQKPGADGDEDSPVTTQGEEKIVGQADGSFQAALTI
jgi:hypothetical protein